MSSKSAMTDLINAISVQVDEVLAILGSYIEKFPGGPIVVRYIRSSHKDDPTRTILEVLLVLFAINYFTSKKYDVKKKDFVKLKESDIDDLVEEWEPEPLALPLKEEEEWKIRNIKVIEGPIKEHVTINGQEVINLGSLNFLNFGSNERVKQESSAIIRQNGVGACGPPNFYGNQDIHIKLEEDLKSFFGTEGAVLYGQDFTTAGSVLPSFLKRGDYIIADSAINVSIQKALLLSRATIYWYNHNDLDHLEQVLEELKERYFQYEKPISRKFIVTEGLFANSGDYPNLTKLVELKKKYKFRLFLDESLSLGVLGATGRGLTEHFGIARSEIDITIGTMANAFSSSGSFCIGDRVMTYHQRIGSLAYCFSASLPAYVAQATSTGIKLLEESINKEGESTIVSNLLKKSSLLFDLFSKDKQLKEFIEVVSSRESPVLHLQLSQNIRDEYKLPARYTGAGSQIEQLNKKCISDKFVESLNNEEKLLQKIVNDALSNGVLITKSVFSIAQETLPVLPHLKVCCNVDLSDSELKASFTVIRNSITSNLEKLDASELDNLSI